jgi:hypothetical protein
VSCRAPALAGTRRGAPVPDDVSRHAGLDEHDTVLRYPLEVEGLRVAARVEAVVREGEALVEDPLAEPPRQIARPLEKPERSERREREVREEIGEGVGLENSALRPRLDLVRPSRSGCLDGGLARDRGRVEVAGPPGGGVGVAGRAVVGRDREHAAISGAI